MIVRHIVEIGEIDVMTYQKISFPSRMNSDFEHRLCTINNSGIIHKIYFDFKAIALNCTIKISVMMNIHLITIHEKPDTRPARKYQPRNDQAL